MGERCRQSYLHDLRGGLQGLYTAVELLVRAAKNPGDNPTLAEKASVLARRAVQNHEQSLGELLYQLTPSAETAVTVDVGEVVAEVLKFVRNDAAGKSVSFRFESAAGVVVTVQARKFRLVVLGLISSLIDAAAPGAVIDIAVARASADAKLEFTSGAPCPAVQDPEKPSALSSLYGLLVALTERWVSANGGRLESPASSDVPNALRIYYPLSSTAPTHASADAAQLI